MARRLPRPFALVSVVAVAVLVAACGPSPLKWAIVSGNSSSTVEAELTGITAITVAGTTTIWAVGDYALSNGSLFPAHQPLLEHSSTNGTSWIQVSVPSSGNGNSVFTGITAVPGAKTIWAVGYNSVSTGFGVTSQPLIGSSNGTSWVATIMPTFGGGAGINVFNAITAANAKDIWAVGSYYDASVATERPLLEHYNGTSWTQFTVPGLSAEDYELRGIARVPGTNTYWAVGSYSNGLSSPAQTLIVYYNGTAWSPPVTSPNPGTQADGLNAVAAVGAKDIWAVGYESGSNLCCNIPEQTLIEHYDGTTWAKASSPFPGTKANELTGIAAVNAKDLWAVGYDVDNTGKSHTLLAYPSGQGPNHAAYWEAFSSPNPGTADNRLNAIAAVNAKDLWAVGYSSENGGFAHPLILHGT
jgi:hypothetical protein